MSVNSDESKITGGYTFCGGSQGNASNSVRIRQLVLGKLPELKVDKVGPGRWRLEDTLLDAKLFKVDPMESGQSEFWYQEVAPQESFRYEMARVLVEFSSG